MSAPEQKKTSSFVSFGNDARQIDSNSYNGIELINTKQNNGVPNLNQHLASDAANQALTSSCVEELQNGIVNKVGTKLSDLGLVAANQRLNANVCNNNNGVSGIKSLNPAGASKDESQVLPYEPIRSTQERDICQLVKDIYQNKLVFPDFENGNNNNKKNNNNNNNSKVGTSLNSENSKKNEGNNDYLQLQNGSKNNGDSLKLDDKVMSAAIAYYFGLNNNNNNNNNNNGGGISKDYNKEELNQISIVSNPPPLASQAGAGARDVAPTDARTTTTGAAAVGNRIKIPSKDEMTRIAEIQHLRCKKAARNTHELINFGFDDRDDSKNKEARSSSLERGLNKYQHKHISLPEYPNGARKSKERVMDGGSEKNKDIEMSN